jgi:hypothetical protein
VHPVRDLIKSLGEIPDWESLMEMSASFLSLPVAFTSGVLVVVGFISGRVCRQLVFLDVVKVAIGSGP